MGNSLLHLVAAREHRARSRCREYFALARGGGLVACIVIGLMNCVASNTVPCEARWCAPGSVCSPGGCATAAELAACAATSDGSACATDSLTNGTCTLGVCRPTDCGDGLVGVGEACDDGNHISGDGCSANCVSNESCGNGILDPSEQCDDANVVDGDGCQRDCRVATCGDAVVDVLFGEVCDDGNTLDADGCAAHCRSSELCGNRVIDTQVGETCDDGNTLDADGCQHHCQIPRCGDAIVDPGEECDAGTANANTPSAVCRTTCRVPRCGDGVRDGGEACDDGNVAAGDGCASDCQSNETCGNGVIDGVADEQCDVGPAGLSNDGCSSTCQAEADAWRGPIALPPAPRASTSFVYDQPQQRLLMVGGYVAGQAIDETWEFSAQRWKQLVPQVSAPLIDSGQLAYDAVRKRVVMVASTNASTGTVQTWEFDGFSWRAPTLAQQPRSLSNHTLVWDGHLQRTILFGGMCGIANSSAVFCDDHTWLYDGTAWQEITTPVAPTPRMFATAAYDPQRQRTVMFGGLRSDGAYSSQAWEFDGVTWVLRQPATRPSARFGAAMTFDPVRRAIVLHGGNANLDTWSYVNGTWTLLANGPTTMANAWYLYWDETEAALHLVTEGLAHWLLRDNAWQPVGVATPPVLSERGAGLVYDALHGGSWYWGGSWYCSNCSDPFPTAGLWFFDGAWKEVVAPGPSPVLASIDERCAAYDSKRQRLVVLFGYTAPNVQMWSYDGMWHALAPVTRPPLHTVSGQCSMVYDALRDRLVTIINDSENPDKLVMWEYDGVDWQANTAANAISPRGFPQLVYHPQRARVMLFGGVANRQVLRDLWEYDGQQWTEVAVPALPPTEALGKIVYHAGRGTLFSIGTSTWEFDGHGWHKRLPVNGGTVRDIYGLTYDPRLRAIVSYQRTADRRAMETHLYEFTNSSIPRERCLAVVDEDGDGLAGCTDPDCAALCTPFCLPHQACEAAAPRCGDGVCDAALETIMLCPSDCPIAP